MGGMGAGVLVWPLLMSLLQAKEYLLLGDRIPAADCLRLGLANRVVPREQVLPMAIDIAKKLAAKPITYAAVPTSAAA